jgi:hypothetical protein
VYGRSADFKSPQMAVQVYLFARQWMILHLMKAVENFLEPIRTEDVLKILENFVDEDNIISSKCLDVSNLYFNNYLVMCYLLPVNMKAIMEQIPYLGVNALGH